MYAGTHKRGIEVTLSGLKWSEKTAGSLAECNTVRRYGTS